MRVLGIETSADDTGIALIDANGDPPVGGRSGFQIRIIADERISQSAHRAYGGIYPNLAKKEHAKNLPLLLKHIVGVYETTTIDAIAVTVGPGLEPCLWQGITFAQELAQEWSVPIVPVNHMEGHIVVSMVDFGSNPDTSFSNEVSELGLHELEFPVVVLLISGGHTELILMKDFGTYKYIGRTRDDAVGEAFDKVARTLGLPYPGGSEISRLAAEARNQGDALMMPKLPRPMLHDDTFDFSFAGLKTAVLRIVKKEEMTDELRRQIAREFEDAVTDVLAAKTMRAAEEYGASAVVLGGGVSANRHIRAEFSSMLRAAGCKLLVCPPAYSTDNALMIALAGYFHALNNNFADPATLSANGSLKLDQKT